MPIASIPGIPLARCAFQPPPVERWNLPTHPGFNKTPAFGASLPRSRSLGAVVAVPLLPLFLSACGGGVQALAQPPAGNVAVTAAPAPELITLQALQEAYPQFEPAVLQDVLTATQRIRENGEPDFSPGLILGLLSAFNQGKGFRSDNLLGLSPEVAKKYGVNPADRVSNFVGGGRYLWELSANQETETGIKALRRAALEYYSGDSESQDPAATAFADIVVAQVAGPASHTTPQGAPVTDVSAPPPDSPGSKSTIPGISPEDLKAIRQKHPGITTLALKKVGSPAGEGVFLEGPHEGIASVMKVQVAATILRLVEEQGLSMETPISVPATLVDEAETNRVGYTTTLQNALYGMLTDSSNSDSNGLVYYFGGGGDFKEAARRFTRRMQERYPHSEFVNYFNILNSIPRDPTQFNKSAGQDVVEAMNDLMLGTTANHRIVRDAMAKALPWAGSPASLFRKTGSTPDNSQYTRGVISYVIVAEVNEEQWIVFTVGNRQSEEFSGVSTESVVGSVRDALTLLQQHVPQTSMNKQSPAALPEPRVGRGPTASSRRPFEPGQMPAQDPKGRRGFRRA